MNKIGDAFAFPFRDPEWFSKFFVGALMVLLSMVLIGLFPLMGYFVRVTQRVMRKEPNPLPDWSDFGQLFALGFKFVVLYIIYLLPIFAILLVFLFLAIGAAISEDEAVVLSMLPVFYLVVFFVIVPYSIALSIFMPVITIRFAQRGEISDGLALGEILRFFKKNWANTLIVALIIFGLESIEGIGLLIAIVGVFFTIFYSGLVSYHLIGQLYAASLEPRASA